MLQDNVSLFVQFQTVLIVMEMFVTLAVLDMLKMRVDNVFFHKMFAQETTVKFAESTNVMSVQQDSINSKEIVLTALNLDLKTHQLGEILVLSQFNALSLTVPVVMEMSVLLVLQGMSLQMVSVSFNKLSAQLQTAPIVMEMSVLLVMQAIT